MLMPQPNIGVGLRPTHYPYLEPRPQTNVTWFEAVSENYMDTKGRPLDMLELIRKDYPVALHGVSLSIASTEGLRQNYLHNLRNLVERINPFIVSDHLCWTGLQQQNLHDLLPIPFTDEALNLIVDHVDQVQTCLSRQILLENVSTYLLVPEADWAEWDFLNEVANRSGCGILLDINNLYVNAKNHQFDPYIFLEAISMPQLVSFLLPRKFHPWCHNRLCSCSSNSYPYSRFSLHMSWLQFYIPPCLFSH